MSNKNSSSSTVTSTGRTTTGRTTTGTTTKTCLRLSEPTVCCRALQVYMLRKPSKIELIICGRLQPRLRPYTSLGFLALTWDSRIDHIDAVFFNDPYELIINHDSCNLWSISQSCYQSDHRAFTKLRPLLVLDFRSTAQWDQLTVPGLKFMLNPCHMKPWVGPEYEALISVAWGK